MRRTWFAEKVEKMNFPSVRDVFTPVAITVGLHESLHNARQMFRQHHIKQLPVMDKGKLIGLIKEKDVLLILGPDFDYPKESELQVEDAYTSDPLIVDHEASLVDTLFLLAEHRCGCALVTRGGILTGIFTDTDACRCFGSFLQKAYLTSSI